ncbi:MAG: sigma-70 family RNA polymerase sigma factor [Planctomycetes bacterium]|nr:sigma-70 family RNA polymerase sigma factor [Planctomycetota bacterium]
MDTQRPPLDDDDLKLQVAWVRRLAFNLLRDAHVADDVAQDTMAAALEHDLDLDASPRGWLATVTRNFVRQTLRIRARRTAREQAAARSQQLPSASDALERAESFRNAVNAVLSLEEPLRSTVLLRFFEQLPPREIARRQGVPVATVHTRLARAFDKLRILLAHDENGARRQWPLALLPILKAPFGGAGVLEGPSLFLTLMKAKTAIAWTLGAAILAAILIFIYQFTNGPRRDANPEGALAARGAVDESVASAAAAPGGRSQAPAEVRGGDGTASRADSSPAKGAPQSLQMRTVRGRVIDCDSQAVSGIAVEIHSNSPSALEAVTDPDGIFEFKGFIQNGEVLTKSDRYTNVFTGSIPGPGADVQPVLIVAPKITYAGNVVDGRGNPVEAAEVRFALPADFRGRFKSILDFSVPRAWAVRTDRDGKFEFTDVPEVRGSKFIIHHSRFAPFDEPAPQASSWNIILKLTGLENAAEFLFGRVIDLQGLSVGKARVSDGQNAYKTDVDGYFTIPGGGRRAVALTAAARGLLPATAEIQYSEKSGWPDHTILRLGGPALSIAGRVSAPDGGPAARAKVWIDNAQYFGEDSDNFNVLEGFLSDSGSWGYIVDTDARGFFEIKGLLDKKYTLKALDPATLFVAESEPIAAGDRDALIQLQKLPVHARIAGVVVNHAGAPIAGVRVGVTRTTFMMHPTPDYVFSHDEPRPTDSLTDAAGKFELINVPKEGVYLTFHADHILSSQSEVPSADPENMKIVVAQRCHMKIELAGDADAADGFQLLDAAGKVLKITVIEGNSSSSSSMGSLVRGMSSLVAVPDTAATLVIIKKQNEVRRVPVELKPGEPRVIRP